MYTHIVNVISLNAQCLDCIGVTLGRNRVENPKKSTHPPPFSPTFA